MKYEIDPVLWEISKDEQSNYVKYLYPPIDACCTHLMALSQHRKLPWSARTAVETLRLRFFTFHHKPQTAV